MITKERFREIEIGDYIYINRTWRKVVYVSITHPGHFGAAPRHMLKFRKLYKTSPDRYFYDSKFTWYTYGDINKKIKFIIKPKPKQNAHGTTNT